MKITRRRNGTSKLTPQAGGETVWIPGESKTKGFFQTTDRQWYRRDKESGVIRRVSAETGEPLPKVRGKKARRAEKKARQAQRA
jgi:hypothetical protein